MTLISIDGMWLTMNNNIKNLVKSLNELGPSLGKYPIGFRELHTIVKQFENQGLIKYDIEALEWIATNLRVLQ